MIKFNKLNRLSKLQKKEHLRERIHQVDYALKQKRLYDPNKPNCSCCMITWNEEEMLPYCLAFLDSIQKIGEICIVDSFSTDRTPEIVEEFKTKTKKEVKFLQREFDNFANQRNACSDLAKNKWILYIDADETYSQCLNNLLILLDELKDVNAVRINTLTLFQDRKHYIRSYNFDPHIRIWKRNFAKFHYVIHECLCDDKGRSLHDCTDVDIFNAIEFFPNLYMKHAQLLKSEKSLREKGERLEAIRMIEESEKRGIKIHKNIWVEWKHGTYELAKLNTEMWDITTELTL